MKNSRKDGTLVVKLDKGYKMAIDGQMVDRHRVKCLEFDYKTEGVAANLEQYLSISMMSQVLPSGNETYKKEKSDDEKKMMDFYKSESPLVEEVEEHAQSFEIMAKYNKEIKMSEIMKTFEEFVYAKIILMEGDIPMPLEIWRKLSLPDKNKIIFSYIAFFVNPLQRLVEKSSKMDEKQENMQGDSKKI